MPAAGARRRRPGKPSPEALRALKELKRYGLLLVTDARLPSLVALVAGAPVRGSWWSHPRGKAKQVSRRYPTQGAAAGGKPTAWAPFGTGPKPSNSPCSAPLTPAGGPIFLQTCALYWGCRFAGYGNKWPSQ